MSFVFVGIYIILFGRMWYEKGFLGWFGSSLLCLLLLYLLGFCLIVRKDVDIINIKWIVFFFFREILKLLNKDGLLFLNLNLFEFFGFVVGIKNVRY